jgi:hypothetical protein
MGTPAKQASLSLAVRSRQKTGSTVPAVLLLSIERLQYSKAEVEKAGEGQFFLDASDRAAVSLAAKVGKGCYPGIGQTTPQEDY